MPKATVMWNDAAVDAPKPDAPIDVARVKDVGGATEPAPVLDAADERVPDAPFCGDKGQPCCPGQFCLQDGCCVNDRCVGSGLSCEPGSSDSCVDRACGGFGSMGKACWKKTLCTEGWTSCVMKLCDPCGGLDQLCCPDGACRSGDGQPRTVCRQEAQQTERFCRACGGKGQPCCSDGKCDAADQCCSDKKMCVSSGQSCGGGKMCAAGKCG